MHALTTRLVREFDLIAIEHLNVKALSRGMHARAIQDAAFGEFRRQLLYKADAAGSAKRAPRASLSGTGELVVAAWSRA